MQLQAHKKRSISYKKANVNLKNSSHLNKKKNPLQIILQNQIHISTPNQRSLPKTHYKTDNNIKKKDKSGNKGTEEKRKNLNKIRQSPKKENQTSSNKKHKKSKDYDSPSKQHQDLEYLIIQPHSSKSTKFQKASSQIESLINAGKDKLRKNLTHQAIIILNKAKQKEDNNYQINYLLGVCYLIAEQYANAVTIFKKLIEMKKVKKNVFLLLSVCYKKMEEYANTEKVLNLCLQKYPKFYEAYIYRGKLFIKLKKFHEANSDFQEAIKLFPSKQIAYIGKGDCLRSSENYTEAIELYNAAMKIESSTSVLLRRAICYLQLQRFDLALSDINLILGTDSQNSEAMYFKGLIYNKKKNYNEAIICYEQAIKFNSNKKAVTRSIYQIAKIKIELRDYYEAFYTLSRAQYLDIQIKSLQKFKTFTDGVTSLMKKNYEKGIQILDDLIKQHSLSKFLKPLFYSSRAYGLMYQQQFQEARSDLIRIQKQFGLDPPNLYNKFICEGILSCKADKYQQALAYFSKAGKISPKRLEPNFYKAVTLIRFSAKLIPKNMVQKKKQYLSSALKTATKIPKIIQNNPSLFLVLGVLKFALGDVQSSINDFHMSIQDSVTPKPVCFYLKGLALANIGRIKEALQQLNTAIQQDQKKHYPEIYLNRAKCHLILNEANKAFQDLQTFMTYRPSSPEIHIWAGHLLFTINAYQDAAKAYSNISNIQKNPSILFQRAKCCLSFKDIAAAELDLKQILQIQPTKQIQFDYIMIQALRLCSEQINERFERALIMIKKQKKVSQNYGKIFLRSDYCYYKGVLYFYLKNYEKAIKNFEKSFKQKQTQIHSSDGLPDSDEPDFYKLSFSNNAYNIHQYHYNLALCHILTGNLAKSLKYLKLILEKVENQKIKKQIQIFIHFLNNQIKISLSVSKPKNPPSQEQPEFFPFPYQNRLCSIFPETILPLSQNIRTRLFFCLPLINKPNIRPKLEEKILQQIDMKWIDIKPEAPWIRRSEQGVIFTDQVIGYDVQLSQSSEKQQHVESQQGDEFDEFEYRNQGHQYEQQERQDRNSQNICNKGYIQQSDEEMRQQPIKNKKNFLESLKLDKQTEAKLNKFCKN